MMAHTMILLNFSSEKRLKIVRKALKPETRGLPHFRSRVHLEGTDNTLKLIFEANDTSALRAALNSYLRLTSSIMDTLRLMAAMEEQ